MAEEHSDEEFEEADKQIRSSTVVIITPEDDPCFMEKGAYWLYSWGMKENYDMPDIEMRGVPSSFKDVAGSVINQINAYRLVTNEDNPILFGQKIQWSTGVFQVYMSEDWDGRYTWKAEDMLRLGPIDGPPDVGPCVSCEMDNAGAEP